MADKNPAQPPPPPKQPPPSKQQQAKMSESQAGAAAPAPERVRAPATLVVHPSEASLPPSLAFFLIGGALFHYLSFPPAEQAWAGWLAPFCWLAAMDRFPTWRGRFKALFFVSLIAVGAETSWLWSEFGAAAVVLWAIIACYFGLWGAGIGAAEKWPNWIAYLWPACAWCGVEYLRGEVAPLSFSWLALGYTQQNAVAAWLAPLVGVYGVSFLMALWATAALLALRVAEDVESPARNKGVAALAGLAIVPMLSFFPAPEPPARDPLATLLLAQTMTALDTEGIQPRPPAIASAKEPVDLIVWPEYAIFNDPSREEVSWFPPMVRGAAATAKRGLIYGAKDIPADKPSDTFDFQNTAFVLSPQGEVVGKAGKSQPVYFMRDGRAAPDVSVLSVPNGPPLRLGVGVCFDGAYQRFARQMADKGAVALVFPTYNKPVWGANQHRQHQRMFQTRAAETGLAVATAANAGPTFVAAPGGRVAEELSFGSTGTLLASLPPPAGGPTLFVQFGWLLGPAALLLFALGLASAMWSAWVDARNSA